MSRDDRIVLEVVDGQLYVDGPDDVLTDDVVAALGVDKTMLQMTCEVFGSVSIVSAGIPSIWPPRGGFVPAWRRLRPGKPLIVLPSEHVPDAIDPYAAEPPTVPCPTCTKDPRAATPPPVSQGQLFETGPWQVCLRCQGRSWYSTDHGDECATCGPMPGSALPPATWVRAGDGWVCSRCHPIPPADNREVCPVCGGKGRCRPDHVARLRAEARRLLTKTKSATKRAQIEAALAALPDSGGGS